jgi:GDPmannose 4,6-dehydratase
LLLEKGYEVAGTSRNAASASFPGLQELGIRSRITIQPLNPADAARVSDVLAGYRPDEVYNLSAQSSVARSFENPDETFESIAQPAVAMLDGIRGAGYPIRYFSAGSSECFGEVEGGLADETTPFLPRNPYGVAKVAAHRTVAGARDSGIYACTGILFNHESPLRPERFVTRKIVAAAARIAAGSREKLSLGNMDAKRDWGWAPDYVDAMWRMLQQETPSDFVIATGKLSSVRDFVEAAFAAFELHWKDHVVVDQQLVRPTDFGYAGNAARAAIKLGWKPTLVMPELVRRLATDEAPVKRAPR